MFLLLSSRMVKGFIFVGDKFSKWKTRKPTELIGWSDCLVITVSV